MGRHRCQRLLLLVTICPSRSPASLYKTLLCDVQVNHIVKVGQTVARRTSELPTSGWDPRGFLAHHHRSPAQTLAVSSCASSPWPPSWLPPYSTLPRAWTVQDSVQGPLGKVERIGGHTAKRRDFPKCQMASHMQGDISCNMLHTHTYLSLAGSSSRATGCSRVNASGDTGRGSLYVVRIV